jgi:hypothetical protein
MDAGWRRHPGYNPDNWQDPNPTAPGESPKEFIG